MLPLLFNNLLDVFKLGPDAQVVLGTSNIVSLKAFVVELKNNCPSCILVNVEGAVHSSVAATTEPVLPPKDKAEVYVPSPPFSSTDADKSLTSVQELPSQASVFAVEGSPPKSKACVLVAPPDPACDLAVFISPVSVHDDPSKFSTNADLPGLGKEEHFLQLPYQK